MIGVTRGVGLVFAVAACATSGDSAMAHPGHPFSESYSFLSGAAHPLLGLDHLLAMLVSGLLAVRMSTSQTRGEGALVPLWLVPLSLVGLIVLGGATASQQIVPLPVMQWGFSFAVIMLGLAVALLPRIPLWMGTALVGLFAFSHGYAHVGEAGSQSSLSYMTGFALTTFVLHTLAIILGLVALRLRRPYWVRVVGAGIAAGFALWMFVD